MLKWIALAVVVAVAACSADWTLYQSDTPDDYTDADVDAEFAADSADDAAAVDNMDAVDVTDTETDVDVFDEDAAVVDADDTDDSFDIENDTIDTTDTVDAIETTDTAESFDIEEDAGIDTDTTVDTSSCLYHTGFEDDTITPFISGGLYCRPSAPEPIIITDRIHNGTRAMLVSGCSAAHLIGDIGNVRYSAYVLIPAGWTAVDTFLAQGPCGDFWSDGTMYSTTVRWEAERWMLCESEWFCTGAEYTVVKRLDGVEVQRFTRTNPAVCVDGRWVATGRGTFFLGAWEADTSISHIYVDDYCVEAL